MPPQQRISALRQAYTQRRRREAKEHYKERVEDYVEVMKVNPEFINDVLREDPKALNNMDNALFEAVLVLQECKLATGRAIFVHDRRGLRGSKNRRKNWTPPGPSPLGEVWISQETETPKPKPDAFSRADWIRKHFGLHRQ